MTLASPLLLAAFVPVLLGYWLLRGRGRLILLLAANYLFYAFWDHRLIWVLLVSTALAYLCGRQISRSGSANGRRAWLAANLVGSLGLLAWFKYHGFFAESLVAAAGAMGWRLSPIVSNVALPLGISYYTFQLLTYSLDIHRGVTNPTRSPLAFAAFASFFPQIVAGPITRAKQLIPQLERDATFDFTHLEIGLRRLLSGLFKKLFVADTLAQHLVDPVFTAPAHYSSVTLGLAVVGYAVQIYADFSGYSSMAIGTARLLGLRLPENFKFPYLSLNIAEFWRRWHITLSRWLRDYVWWALARRVPMTGGFAVRLRSHAALLAVFLLCGLWHGAAWTFVAWGAMHGLFMVTYGVWQGRREPHRSRSAIPRWAGVLAAWLTTQVAVGFSWVLFRAGDLGVFGDYLTALLLGTGTQTLALPPLAWLALLALPGDHVAGWVLEHRPQVRQRIPAPVQAAGYVAMIVFLFHARVAQANPFVYFRF